MLVVVVLHSEMSVLAVVAVLRPPESERLCSCSESAVAYSGSRLLLRALGGRCARVGGVLVPVSALRCTSATWMMLVGVGGREQRPDERRLVLADEEELAARSSMLREGVTMAMSGGAAVACVLGAVWVGVAAVMVCRCAWFLKCCCGRGV